MASSGLSQNSKLFSDAFNHCKSSVRLRSSSSDNTVYTAPDGKLSTFSRGLKTPLENSTLMLIVCVPIYCELSSLVTTQVCSTTSPLDLLPRAIVTILRERERNQLTGRVLPPCRHDDVLLAVQHVGHRSPRRSPGQFHLPQHFA